MTGGTWGLGGYTPRANTSGSGTTVDICPQFVAGGIHHVRRPQGQKLHGRYLPTCTIWLELIRLMD